MKDVSAAEISPHLVVLPGCEDDEVAELRVRAERLRTRAESSSSILAMTYRRRASELEFQAWLTELRAGHMVGPVAA